MSLNFEELCETLVEFAREHGWQELQACMDEAKERLDDEEGSGDTDDNFDFDDDDDDDDDDTYMNEDDES